MQQGPQRKGKATGAADVGCDGSAGHSDVDTGGDDCHQVVDAGFEGAGVAVGPPQLFREELASGRLFQPFPQIVDSGKAWWFVCPPASVSRPKTRAFEEWLIEELSAPQSRSGRPALAATGRR